MGIDILEDDCRQQAATTENRNTGHCIRVLMSVKESISGDVVTVQGPTDPDTRDVTRKLMEEPRHPRRHEEAHGGSVEDRRVRGPQRREGSRQPVLHQGEDRRRSQRPEGRHRGAPPPRNHQPRALRGRGLPRVQGGPGGAGPHEAAHPEVLPRGRRPLHHVRRDRDRLQRHQERVLPQDDDHGPQPHRGQARPQAPLHDLQHGQEERRGAQDRHLRRRQGGGPARRRHVHGLRRRRAGGRVLHVQEGPRHGRATAPP